MESGYYQGNVQAMLGIARVVTQTPAVTGSILNQHQYQGILGLGYRVHPRVLLQLDYQSGTANSATAGFTYNISPQLQLNPAVYISNAASHKVWGYAVLTWNIDVFAPRSPQPSPPAAQPESQGQKDRLSGQ